MQINQKPYIIGITGGSGSGKTTFLHQLTNAFDEKQICVVSQDDYYRPRDQQEVDEKGVHNFDLPNSIDSQALKEDLEKLLAGNSITKEEYTFNNKTKVPKILTFHPTPVIILEGLFIFHYPEIAALIDLKLFVQAKETLKVIRRISRDQIERNYPIEDVLYRYEAHVLPAFEKYILPYKDDADIIINNNGVGFPEALAVITGFVQSKL